MQIQLLFNIGPNIWASQVALVVKNPTANTGDLRDVGQSLNWEDPLEKDMATHITVLA